MATEGPGQAVVSPPREQRNPRPVRIGVVRSAMRNKTIKVAVPYQVKHGKYGKYLRREMVLHAHDEHNEARLGDLVEVHECRPISKTKHWRLIRVMSKAPEQPQATTGGGA